MTLNLEEPTRVDEPTKVEGWYADMISRVLTERQAVIVRRDGADVAVVLPFECLELLQDSIAREKALEMARKLDWDRLVKENPPPQSWFEGDEPKPF